jgi:RNA polymerase sigma-70 factor (ECF subfamily)
VQHDADSAAEGAADDRRLLEALRAGDEAAFASLLERHQATLLRVARIYVADPAVAEDVVQETWVAVLRGLDRFEARSSLKTWIVRILVKRALARATREARSVTFSSLSNTDADAAEPAVDPGRFHPTDRSWISPPCDWDKTPEQLVLARETRDLIDEVVASLPPSQREVITLRDIEGWTSAEVCDVLTPSNFSIGLSPRTFCM